MEPIGAWLLALFIVAIFVTIFLLMIGTMVWGFNRLLVNHQMAQCYRQMLAEQAQNPSMPDQWALTYKVGRTQKVVLVQGKTEAEALAAATRLEGFTYDKIVSLVKK